MNRAFYIVGIVFAVIFFFFCGYYIAEVESARSAYLYDSFYGYSDYGYGSYYSSYTHNYASDYTEEAALWSIFFFLLFITIDLLGLLKVKTKTTKIMSIIGLSISGIFLLWNFGVLADPGAMSFDEVGGAWILYSFIMLAFSIVGLTQAVRFSKGGGQPQAAAGAARPLKEESDLLDS